jgi:hypothetical protein
MLATVNHVSCINVLTERSKIPSISVAAAACADTDDDVENFHGILILCYSIATKSSTW